MLNFHVWVDEDRLFAGHVKSIALSARRSAARVFIRRKQLRWRSRAQRDPLSKARSILALGPAASGMVQAGESAADSRRPRTIELGNAMRSLRGTSTFFFTELKFTGAQAVLICLVPVGEKISGGSVDPS